MRALALAVTVGWMAVSISSRAELPNQAEVANAIELKVEKFTLANGLTVLVHEDHSAPFFSYQQWFRVGSKHEKPGRTGLAHFFEHLMFKGTSKYPGKTLDRLVQANGGSFNAFTTRDFTGYYINLPSDKLALAVDIEADRMRNLLFDPKEIDSEREVVKEERRFRVDNEVWGLLEEKLWRTVFKVHPYHWPVIGSMADLNQASLEDMKEFYRIYYAPNNAVVVVVGDVTASQVKKLIEKHYAAIPSQTLPSFNPPTEPAQLAERQARVFKAVQNPTVTLAFRTVKTGDAEMYPLDLAAMILGSGSSSRLYRRLVYQEQVASSVSVSSYTPGEPGMFRVNLSLKPGQAPERVLRSVYAELFKLRDKPVAMTELDKVKNQAMKDYVESLKTISGKANALAIHEVYFGDYRVMFKDLEEYLKVTPEQIVAVAKKYFQPQLRNIVRVEAGTPPATVVPNETDSQSSSQGEPQ